MFEFEVKKAYGGIDRQDVPCVDIQLRITGPLQEEAMETFDKYRRLMMPIRIKVNDYLQGDVLEERKRDFRR